MNFTYNAYKEMLSFLKQNNYEICGYENYKECSRTVILRHDVDFSLEAALSFARLEYENNIRATYFVLLSTSFYNIFHKESNDIIKEIKGMGHDIGLHFDEARYPIYDVKDLIYYVEKEAHIMTLGIDTEIKTVSMHRPSKWVLEADVKFDTLINSYSKEFLNDFKYLSDSRMSWRENVTQIIQSKQYKRLHILTHPIWYADEVYNIKDHLVKYINSQKYECYENIKGNIRGLEEVLCEKDITD